MVEGEFEFDAPNVCENLLIRLQDENILNQPGVVSWFLKLHHHEAKQGEKATASFTQQHISQSNHTPDVGSNELNKHAMAVKGTGVKRGGSKLPVPVLISDNVLKKKQRVSTTTIKKVAVSSSNDLPTILKMHNAKHKQKSIYEPPRHSVRDVRRWERKHMKVWSDLTHEEREIANAEISAEKKINTNR